MCQGAYTAVQITDMCRSFLHLNTVQIFKYYFHHTAKACGEIPLTYHKDTSGQRRMVPDKGKML